MLYIYIYTHLYMNSLMYHSWVRKSVSWGIYHQKKRPFRFKGFSATHLVGNSTEIHMDFIWLVVSTPLKNMKVSLWKNKIHVPNHQPVMIHPIFSRY